MVTLKEAQEVARMLTAKISPVAVILFGSVAREGRGEDLDLLVVTGREPDYGQVGQALEDYYSRFAIDYFVASVDQITGYFRKGSPWLRLIQQEGRVLYMDESFRDWERLSLEDWEQAQYLLNGGFYRGVCFSSQQAVERALKGEMLRRGWELEKIHSLRRLLSIARSLELKLDYDGDDIDFMDSIYRGRYPAEEGLLPLQSPSKEDAQRAVEVARRFLKQLGVLQS